MKERFVGNCKVYSVLAVILIVTCILVFYTNRSQSIRCYEWRYINAPNLTSVAFSTDGKTLALIKKNQLELQDLPSGRITEVIRNEGYDGNFVCISPDLNYLLTLSHDETTVTSHSADLWNVIAKKKLRLVGHKDVIWSACFSQDGGILATASWDKTTKLWDVRSGRLLHTLTGHPDRVLSTAFSQDGRFIATGGEHGVVKVWNTRTGKLLNTLLCPCPGMCPTLAMGFLPNCRTLLTFNGAMERFWDINTGQLVKTLKFGAEIDEATFSRNCQFIVGSSITTDVLENAHGQISVYNAATGHKVCSISHGFGQIWSVVVSPNDNLIAVVGEHGTNQSGLSLWYIGDG